MNAFGVYLSILMKNVEPSGITKQVMPGPSGDLEEWQTKEVNVIDLVRH